MTMIHICDYGSGNIHNVEKALLRAGAQVKVCSSVDDLINVNALVIPGVGAFGDCIEALRAKGFEKKIKELADSGVWILGICVGMQVLATYGRSTACTLVWTSFLVALACCPRYLSMEIE